MNEDFVGFERRDFDIGVDFEVLGSTKRGKKNSSTGRNMAEFGGRMTDEGSESVIDRNSHLEVKVFGWSVEFEECACKVM